MYESFKKMPVFLKFITVHALACFVFAVMVLVPGMTITYNGEPMKSAELWDKGLALLIVFIGLSLPVAGVLLVKRSQYSRKFYSALLLLVMVVPYIYWQEYVSLIFGVAVSAAIIGYLFISGGVRAYFSS